MAGRHLVIFGCGYIGGEVAREALERGLRVTALTRNAAKAEGLRAQGLDVLVADLATEAWHRELRQEPDYVLNTVSSGGGGVEGYRRSYVEGMQSILRWASTLDFAGAIVYTSSTSVYPQDHGLRVNESASTEGAGELPGVLITAEQTLLDAHPIELRAQASGRTSPFQRAFVLRLAGIYGPGRHHLIDQVKSGAVSGRGDHHLNLAHRDDIAAAIWSAWQAPHSSSSEIYNVADDGAATKREVVTWLAEQLGRPVPTFTGAPVAGRRGITPDRIIDNQKLKTELGWQPRFPTFREGYKNMLALPS